MTKNNAVETQRMLAAELAMLLKDCGHDDLEAVDLLDCMASLGFALVVQSDAGDVISAYFETVACRNE